MFRSREKRTKNKTLKRSSKPKIIPKKHHDHLRQHDRGLDEHVSRCDERDSRRHDSRCDDSNLSQPTTPVHTTISMTIASIIPSSSITETIDNTPATNWTVVASVVFSSLRLFLSFGSSFYVCALLSFFILFIVQLDWYS